MKGEINIPDTVGEQRSDTVGEEMVGEDACDSSSGERILGESSTRYKKSSTNTPKGWLIQRDGWQSGLCVQS
jgi:hypothetical protein